MIYTLKRYFSYHVKALAIYFRTKKNLREIAKAYRTEEVAWAPTITRPMLIWTGAAVGVIGVVSLGILFSGTLVHNIQTMQEALSSRRKAALIRRQEREAERRREREAAQRLRMKEPAVEKEEKISSIPEETTPPSDLQKKAMPIGKDMRYCILANKSNHMMYVLYKRSTAWELFRTYSIAIGEEEGRKVRVGDKKTPEGLYFIIGRRERSELNSMYGPLAFVLNYPNAEDRKAGRTGNGIWIHGTNPDSLPLQTRGCLELNNLDIIEMGGYLKTGIGTPVVIVKRDDITDPTTFPDYTKIARKRRNILSEYQRMSTYFISLLDQWKNAWESRNIDTYTGYYYPERFFGQGMEWEAWKERKARTFEMYDTITISLNKIFLAEFSESTAVLKFLQGYKSDRMNVMNGKRLNLTKSNGTWKIYRENSLPKEELLL